MGATTIPDCQAKNTAEELPPAELGFRYDIRLDPKGVGVWRKWHRSYLYWVQDVFLKNLAKKNWLLWKEGNYFS